MGCSEWDTSGNTETRPPCPACADHGQLAGREHQSRLDEDNATLSRC